METNKPEATQLPLTPEAANPPPEKPKVKPDAGNWNVIPDEILPPEDPPLSAGNEAKIIRQSGYLKNGSARE